MDQYNTNWIVMVDNKECIVQYNKFSEFGDISFIDILDKQRKIVGYAKKSIDTSKDKKGQINIDVYIHGKGIVETRALRELTTKKSGVLIEGSTPYNRQYSGSKLHDILKLFGIDKLYDKPKKHVDTVDTVDITR